MNKQARRFLVELTKFSLARIKKKKQNRMIQGKVKSKRQSKKKKKRDNVHAQTDGIQSKRG